MFIHTIGEGRVTIRDLPNHTLTEGMLEIFKIFKPPIEDISDMLSDLM